MCACELSVVSLCLHLCVVCVGAFQHVCLYVPDCLCVRGQKEEVQQTRSSSAVSGCVRVCVCVCVCVQERETAFLATALLIQEQTIDCAGPARASWTCVCISVCACVCICLCVCVSLSLCLSVCLSASLSLCLRFICLCVQCVPSRLFPCAPKDGARTTTYLVVFNTYLVVF